MYKPVHFLFPLFLILFCNTLPAQLSWVKFVEVEKRFIQGGSIFSFVRHMDANNASGNLSLYGYFSRTIQYDVTGNSIIQNYVDSNSVKRTATGWNSAGKITFGHSHSVVYYHDTILGKEYIGVGKSDSVGKFYAAFNVLNTAINKYEPVGNLRFTGNVSGFVYLGNQKTLIFGDFYEASDGVMTQIFYGVAMYDLITNRLEKMPDNCSIGDCGLGGSYFHHSVGNDGTLMVTTGSGSRSHYKKSSNLSWEDNLFPGNPIGGRFIKSLVVSQDTIYTAWQKDSAGYPCYLLKFIRSQGMSWQTIGRLSGTYNPTSTRTTWVNSIHQKKDGTLLVATEATHWNDQALGNNVVNINPVTGVTNTLPVVPTFGQYFGTSRLAVVGEDTYFISDNNLIFGTQTIYVLRDLSITSTRETNSLQKTTSLFPIPASTRVYLKNAKSFLTIMGIDGKVFYSIYAKNNSNYIELDISLLPTGIYLVSCLNKQNEIERHKFIVNH